MGLLNGKNVLITGILSTRSIAYGVAKSAAREGANVAFTYANNDLKDRTLKLAKDFNIDKIYKCDVTNDKDISCLFDQLSEKWGSVHGLVHSIAFAPRDALKGEYIAAIDRESFKIAHDVSSYSLGALAKGAYSLMKNQQASILSLSYLGSQRVFPNYNVMGLAKASLEANVRYLAQSLGRDNIRVNAISAGPIKTLAAAGIGNFGKILSAYENTAALRRNVTIEEVGDAAAFLLSDLSSGITGGIMFVDAGFNIAGIPNLN